MKINLNGERRNADNWREDILEQKESIQMEIKERGLLIYLGFNKQRIRSNEPLGSIIIITSILVKKNVLSKHQLHETHILLKNGSLGNRL